MASCSNLCAQSQIQGLRVSVPWRRQSRRGRMGRFHLTSHHSKQQKMLDRCALASCCSWLKYSVETRPENTMSVWPALSRISIICVSNEPGLNMQKETGNMRHDHNNLFCVQGMPLPALQLDVLALVLGNWNHANMCQSRRLGCRWWRGRSSGSSGGGSGMRGRAPSMMPSLLLRMSSLAGNSRVSTDYQCIRGGSKSACALPLLFHLLCLL